MPLPNLLKTQIKLSYELDGTLIIHNTQRRYWEKLIFNIQFLSISNDLF